MEILADQPELLALAGLASVPASKMAGAFNDAEHFFDHLSLAELARLSDAIQRLQDLSLALVAATEKYAAAARAILDEVPVAD